jgi:hypothetical protein
MIHCFKCSLVFASALSSCLLRNLRVVKIAHVLPPTVMIVYAWQHYYLDALWCEKHGIGSTTQRLASPDVHPLDDGAGLVLAT